MLERVMELIEMGYGYVEGSMYGDCPAEYGEDAIASIECELDEEGVFVEWSVDDEQRIVYGYWTSEDDFE